MATFTEHNEVIVKVDELRDIIRRAYTAGAIEKQEHPALPITFIVETYLRAEERLLRRTK
jgi:hypothetical protein